jgi:hypothetical protein
MIIGQVIGYLALVFVIFSFQRNRRSALLVIMLTGVLLFVISYAFLHAWTGSLANLIEAGVTFVAYKKETKAWARQSFWVYVFIGLYVVTGAIVAKNWVDVLPIIAQIFGAIAVWQTNTRAIRFLMLIPRPLWFAYNFSVGAQAGMITEVLIFISVITGIIRFDVLKQKEK